jgi:predicted ATP-dependent endonuclease of OLD family
VRLARFLIRGFKAVHEIELFMPRTAAKRPGSADFLSLVGENNTGKSSVLEALCLACPGQELTSPTVDHFPGRQPNPEVPIEIELEFDELTDADRQQHAIRAHIHSDKYRIKKAWDKPGGRFEAWAYGPKYTFPTMPEQHTRKAFMEAGCAWPELVNAYEAEHGKIDRFGPNIVEQLQQYAIRKGSPVAVKGEPGWDKNPGGFSAMLDTILPRLIFVHAIRETEEEVKAAKAKSTIRLIVNVLFERHLASNPTVQRFKTAAEDVQRLFVGADKDRFVHKLENQLTAKLSRLIDVRALLDFQPPDVTADLASKTEFWTEDGGPPIRPEHQSHGAQRAIILTLLQHLAEHQTVAEAATYQRPLLLLVEEPEIYLHPQMCRKMRDVLLEIARLGTAQVICTTHSPVFLDLADRHDGIAIFARGAEGRIEARQRTDDVFAGEDEEETRARLRMLLNFDPTANEVFFASRVCLVEGDCEVAALEAVAERLEREHRINGDRYLLQRRGLALVNCRGKWTMPAFQRVLNAFGILYSVVHDQDIGVPVEKANAAILSLLDGDEARRLVHQPNFEEQIFHKKWTRDKPWSAASKIREMNELPTDLIGFFEFVLNAKVEELAAPLTVDDTLGQPLAPLAEPTEGDRRPPRTDLRARLERMRIGRASVVPSSVGPGVIMLAAGPC